MQELINNVVKWGQDRGLDKVGHEAQARYTLKETAELLDAYADKNIEAINDAIGDILVTLIVGASNDYEIGMDVSRELKKDTYSHTLVCTTENLRGSITTFVDDVLNLLGNSHSSKNELHASYIVCIRSLSKVKDYMNDTTDYCSSIKHCLQLAYNEIKNRTGKLVNGQFIKDN